MLRPSARAGLFLVVVAATTPACGDEPSDDTPTGALLLFLDAMDRSSWDDGALEIAYGLLASDAREQLRARAERASSLSHREFEPWEMLPQGRFRRRFSARRGLRERIDGEHAVVTVLGSREGEHADVPLVREGEAWRVVLDIPAMSTGEPEAP